jgi:hypothetical protein
VAVTGGAAAAEVNFDRARLWLKSMIQYSDERKKMCAESGFVCSFEVFCAFYLSVYDAYFSSSVSGEHWKVFLRRFFFGSSSPRAKTGKSTHVGKADRIRIFLRAARWKVFSPLSFHALLAPHDQLTARDAAFGSRLLIRALRSKLISNFRFAIDIKYLCSSCQFGRQFVSISIFTINFSSQARSSSAAGWLCASAENTPLDQLVPADVARKTPAN